MYIREYADNKLVYSYYKESKETAKNTFIKAGFTEEDFNKLLGFIASAHRDHENDLIKNIDGLVSLYIKKNTKEFSTHDLDDVIEDIISFNRLSKSVTPENFEMFGLPVSYDRFKSFTAYKTYEDFKSSIEKMNKLGTKIGRKLAKTADNEGARTVYESPDGSVKVINVTTNDACFKFAGIDTTWCIARENSQSWDNYEHSHKYMIVNTKAEKPFKMIMMLIHKKLNFVHSAWDQNDKHYTYSEILPHLPKELQ